MICHNYFKLCEHRSIENILIDFINLITYYHIKETICNMYSEKIEIFKKQYGCVELKVTSGNFYYEIRRRKKWYYKIFTFLK